MYANQVASILMKGGPREKLIDYLWLVETGNMGLAGNRPRAEAAADRLLQLRGEIDGDAYSNTPLERTAGSHALAAAAHRDR